MPYYYNNIRTVESLKNDMGMMRAQSAINNPKVEKLEKLVSQPKDLFEAVNLKINETNVPKFIVGQKYALKGTICDGFDMETKVYKLVKIVDDFLGTPINSIIVKQISGSNGRIFALSKNDCTYHDIEYENGLQLFPQNLPWIRVKDEVQFNKNNLGTTPLSDIDNTIRYITLKLNGFKDYSDGLILTPSGHLINEENFKKSLRVVAKEPIVYGNGHIIKENEKLYIEFSYPKNRLFNHGNFISSKDEIFVTINLVNKPFSLLETKEDKSYGVQQKYLEGINPNDLFIISWDEFGADTVEEYEAKKAEKERKEAEKIRKAEEAKKTLQLEKEEKVNKAVKRMVDYQWESPSFPIPPLINYIKVGDTIYEIENYINSLDNVFEKVNNDLNGIRRFLMQ